MRHSHSTPRPSLGRLLAVVLACLALVAGIAFAAHAALTDLSATADGPAAPTTAPTEPVPAPTTTTEPVPTTPEPVEIDFTILAAGDVLPHMPLYASARTGDGYDFRPLLAGIDDWVAGADLSICHMEVPLAPEGQQVSGYPLFGTDRQLVSDLADQGWDACSTASNHSLDRGFAGLARTLDVFDGLGLGHAGTARSDAESAEPQLYEVTVDGIETTVAHVSATYGTNGLPIPADAPWSVQLIDADELIEQARAARAGGADLVLVSLHDGQEYQQALTAHQEEVAAALAASGEVDMVIGHHAHVPQELARLEGGPGGEGMWVAYGLGNMISNQDSACCAAATSSGLLAIATVHRTDDGPARIAELEWAGITVDRTGGHRVHVLADVPDGVGDLSAAEIEARYERVREAAGTEVPERAAPPTPSGTLRVVPRSPGDDD